jgi:hypothetical protein
MNAQDFKLGHYRNAGDLDFRIVRPSIGSFRTICFLNVADLEPCSDALIRVSADQQAGPAWFTAGKKTLCRRKQAEC